MDLYIVLGVQRGASAGEIKRAYRRLARRYHPDINPGDREAATRFRQILDAYETLIDPDRRRRYDSGHTSRLVAEATRVRLHRVRFFAVPPRATGRQPLAICSRTSSRVAPTRPRPDGAERGADLHLKALLSFDDAWQGVAVAGVADAPGHLSIVCRHRLSSDRRIALRRVRRIRRGPLGPRPYGVLEELSALRRKRPAAAAARARPATARASRRAPKRINVRIPPGVADGARVRVAGKGHAGVRGGAPGDLYIDVEVKPHPLFHRIDDDLHMVVPIAIHEAALGARVEMPDAGRADAPARAARHAVGPALPPSRAWRAVGARRCARRPGGRGPDCAAAACSTNARRSCCASSGASTGRAFASDAFGAGERAHHEDVRSRGAAAIATWRRRRAKRIT